MGVSDFTTKMIGDKRRWREYKARTRQLPESYRTAVDGIERYLMHFGAVDADSAASIFEDVADIFERAAADETPIRDIVGDDPVQFVDALVDNYEKGGYVARERQRLVDSIAAAEAEQAAAATPPGA
jgi:DNA-binding ferritin-like protein (Dps family)